MPPDSIDIALRCSAEIGLSELHRFIAPYRKEDQKASARGSSIALIIHLLDCTLHANWSVDSTEPRPGEDLYGISIALAIHSLDPTKAQS